ERGEAGDGRRDGSAVHGSLPVCGSGWWAVRPVASTTPRDGGGVRRRAGSTEGGRDRDRPGLVERRLEPEGDRSGLPDQDIPGHGDVLPADLAIGIAEGEHELVRRSGDPPAVGLADLDRLDGRPAAHDLLERVRLDLADELGE